MDRECFPQEMWMSTSEIDMLLRENAEATILKRNMEPIGMGITLPEKSAAELLSEVDTEFKGDIDGIYSYSESILPRHQNLGYGSLLISEMAIRMRARGYKHISAHVRTKHGWNIRRQKILTINKTRMLDDFWQDPSEKVQFQVTLI